MGDIKNFLYAWCGKRKMTPAYEIRAVGNKNRQKFMCEVRVEGFNYAGMGNSTNKKDAQSNAARDFVNYLVRINEVKSEEVPAVGIVPPPPILSDTSDSTASAAEGLPAPMGGPLPPHLALKAEAENNSGVESSGYGSPGPTWDRGANLKDYYSRKEEQEVQATLESEEVDLNAGLHGNWTLENAKARLNQYFQKEKIQGEYKYTQVGPDHNRSFIAEMTIYIKQLGRRIFAREHGSNKKLAAQSCALSLVRQLYHLGVIEAYSGLTKKKEGERVEPYKVFLSPDLELQLQNVVQELDLEIVPPPVDPSMPVILNIGKLAHFEPSQRQNAVGVVPWSPPQSNWNPWTSSNIDEGPLAYASTEQISIEDLEDSSEGVMEVVILDKEEEEGVVVAIKTGLCRSLCIQLKNACCMFFQDVYLHQKSKPISHLICSSCVVSSNKCRLVILFYIV